MDGITGYKVVALQTRYKSMNLKPCKLIFHRILVVPVYIYFLSHEMPKVSSLYELTQLRCWSTICNKRVYIWIFPALCSMEAANSFAKYRGCDRWRIKSSEGRCYRATCDMPILTEKLKLPVHLLDICYVKFVV